MKLASEDTRPIWPCLRDTRRSTSGSIVFSTPSKLTSMVLRIREKSPSEERSWSIETPALARIKSTGWASSNAVSQAANDARSVTSIGLARTVAPRARHASATTLSRAWSRPVRASAIPGAA